MQDGLLGSDGASPSRGAHPGWRVAAGKHLGLLRAEAVLWVGWIVVESVIGCATSGLETLRRTVVDARGPQV